MGYGDPRAWEDDMIDDGHVLWEGLPRDTSADSWKVTAKGKKLWDDFERYVNHLPEERLAIDEHGHDWRYEIIPWCGHRCLPGIAGSNYINNGQHEYHAVCPNVKSTGSLNHELGMGVWSHCAGCTARALTTAADIAQFAAEHPKPPESGPWKALWSQENMCWFWRNSESNDESSAMPAAVEFAAEIAQEQLLATNPGARAAAAVAASHIAMAAARRSMATAAHQLFVSSRGEAPTTQ
jgi:hypothetical protein